MKRLYHAKFYSPKPGSKIFWLERVEICLKFPHFHHLWRRRYIPSCMFYTTKKTENAHQTNSDPRLNSYNPTRTFDTIPYGHETRSENRFQKQLFFLLIFRQLSRSVFVLYFAPLPPGWSCHSNALFFMVAGLQEVILFAVGEGGVEFCSFFTSVLVRLISRDLENGNNLQPSRQ